MLVNVVKFQLFRLNMIIMKTHLSFTIVYPIQQEPEPADLTELAVNFSLRLLMG